MDVPPRLRLSCRGAPPPRTQKTLEQCPLARDQKLRRRVIETCMLQLADGGAQRDNLRPQIQDPVRIRVLVRFGPR